MSTTKELRELLAAATPGPWQIGSVAYRCVKPSHDGWHPGSTGSDPCVYDHRQVYRGESWDRCVSSATDELIGYDDYGPVLDSAADAALIAALRNEAPGLLDRVEALEEALRISEAAMDHVVTVEPEGTCDICESCTEKLKRARGRAHALLRDGEGNR